jgi:hypothetical protein
VRKPKYAPVTLSELDGVRYLHFGTEWVQGAMRIRKPNWPDSNTPQQMMAWMLWQEQPRRIAQLGLGTAALTKFCYATFPEAQITAIELNPSVIAICETMFKLPPNDERLQVLEQDALDYVNEPASAPWTRCRSTCTTPPRAARCWTRRVLPGLQCLPERRRHHDRQPVRRPPQLCAQYQGHQVCLCAGDLPAAGT